MLTTIQEEKICLALALIREVLVIYPPTFGDGLEDLVEIEDALDNYFYVYGSGHDE